jgi:hypothetical protein
VVERGAPVAVVPAPAVVERGASVAPPVAVVPAPAVVERGASPGTTTLGASSNLLGSNLGSEAPGGSSTMGSGPATSGTQSSTMGAGPGGHATAHKRAKADRN